MKIKRKTAQRKNQWKAQVSNLLSQLTGPGKRFAQANVDAVKRSCEGYGPDSSGPDPSSGARVVVNIASVHVTDFIKDGYKNGYDLKRYRVGEDRKGEEPKTRELVDAALPVVDESNIYFGAASLSGTGIRFYGDICMVLKGQVIPATTVVLDRNSYDLVRKPFSTTLKGLSVRLKRKASELSGSWAELPYIAATKAVFPYSGKTRRMTSGQIAAELLDDEDYIEVLKEGSFSASDLEAARISSPEASAASHIEGKQSLGPPATAAELLFVMQRRQALKALDASGVDVVVSTTSGRTK